MRFFQALKLFEFDGGRGLGGVVKEDAVDVLDLVDDAVGRGGDGRGGQERDFGG